MKKKYKITESQYNQLIAEGVTINGETNSNGMADTSATAQAMSDSGVDPKKSKVQFDGTAMTGGGQSMTEHRLVTKRELQTNRLRYLKENSEVVSFNNFVKSLK